MTMNQSGSHVRVVELNGGRAATQDPPRPRAGHVGNSGLEVAVALLAGVFLLAAGLWALGWPRTVAKVVGFEVGERFLPDIAAVAIGIGVGLLLALMWRDPLATVLAASLAVNVVLAVTGATDQGLDAPTLDGWLVGVSVLVAIALWGRMRQLGYVVGRVTAATTSSLAPFVEQKTVVLETYRRSGAPVPTAISIAVDGDRAVIRTFEKAGKTRRLRQDPTVTVAPSTSRGRSTAPGIQAHARRLEGAEARAAATLLRRKYPLLHGVLVPVAHRAGRTRTGRTVHFELSPETRNNA
jgi:PPOX class probable F420-dependent enzyme